MRIDVDAFLHARLYKEHYFEQRDRAECLAAKLSESLSGLALKNAEIDALRRAHNETASNLREAKQAIEELQQVLAAQESIIDLLKSEMSTKKTRTRKKSSEEAGSEAEN